MNYRSISFPEPFKGQKTDRELLVVPNQSLSLQEILQRFTRNEALPIGKDVQFHESEDDLEKLAHMDLVDKAEFAQKMADVQKDYDIQEKKKAAKAKKKLEEEALEKARLELKQAATADPAK